MRFSIMMAAFGVGLGFAEEPVREVTLPPVIVEGSLGDLSPIDFLKEDPVLPLSGGNARTDGGSGSLVRELENHLPFSVRETSKPGELTTFRGLGSSAEDVDVQVLGVSLNPPQGGGFDLSTFPQYMWKSFRYQVGPSPAVSDPRAVSGTLSLVPWTATALTGDWLGVRVTQFHSDRGVRQISAGAHYGDVVAALAGFSDGDARGPSGSVSGRWSLGGERVSGKYHLLFTRMDAAIRGSTSFPTPRARQLTARVIPILQADAKLAGGVLLKTAFFFDGMYLRYYDPDSDFLTADQVRQGGFENALSWERWKFGLSLKRTSYHRIDFEAPDETLGTLQATRDIELGPYLIQPTAQVVGVSRYGVAPAGTVGVRREDGPLGTFVRGSYSWRYPTSVDRYYWYPRFYGNPDLRVERDYTGTLGVEWKERLWGTGLQGYAQFRSDAQVLAAGAGGLLTVRNSDRAVIGAVIHTARVRLWDWLDLSNALSWTRSHIYATGLEFPFMPAITEVLGVSVHPESDTPAWSLGASVRGVSSAQAALSGDRVPGYVTVDLDAESRLVRVGSGELRVSARVENLLGRVYEIVPGYPIDGRAVSLGLLGDF